MPNIKMTLKKYDVVYIGSKVDSIDDEPQSFNSKINAILVRTCVCLHLLVICFVIQISSVYKNRTNSICSQCFAIYKMKLNEIIAYRWPKLVASLS